MPHFVAVLLADKRGWSSEGGSTLGVLLDRMGGHQVTFSNLDKADVLFCWLVFAPSIRFAFWAF